MSESIAQSVRYLTTRTGGRLAYHYSSGAEPTVVFLGGYASDMTGSKALYLETYCRARGQAFLRLDYGGHGLSSGDFLQGTIGSWADDALTVIDAATAGRIVLVGSSMGGWIMLLVALGMPDRIHGLVGIAAAPDFTEDLMWAELDPEQQTTLRESGELHLPSEYVDDPYPITWRLIEEGRGHLLLRGPLEIECPVRLIHGLVDPDVPWQTSLTLAERLISTDVTVTLIKGGGHRLSEPEELKVIAAKLAELVEFNQTAGEVTALAGVAPPTQMD